MRKFLLLVALAPSLAMAQDNPCIENPVFPTDCVTQLGPIGEPVALPPEEGFLNIASPVIDPILRLSASGPKNGHLYVLNPTSNMVRVLDPGAALAVVADIPVCYRPSALAQTVDGSTVLVACHASHAIQLIDTTRNLVVGSIQDRETPGGRPLLQEPMAMAVSADTVYVASSQNHRIAEIDLVTGNVTRYLNVPGTEPRSVRLTPNGQFLVVANFLAGNRTEPELGFLLSLVQPGNQAGAVCRPLLVNNPAALAVFQGNSPTFMDTSHPDFPTIAECYLLNHLFAPAQSILENPFRSDHDVVVIRLSDGQVVSSTNDLALDVGSVNYDIRLNDAGTRVYLATTHARNGLEDQFQPRPILNRLVTLDLVPATGALSLPAGGIKELDDNFLAPDGTGTSLSATPHAVTINGSQVLVTAAGSDRLLVLDTAGVLTSTIPVGFGPKGVVADGTTAWVYNSLAMTVSQVDLTAGTETATASIGPSPLPQAERIGGRLFNSAMFASNQTFSCASCHPDGHLDGLVWKLNDIDNLRATMTIQEISETAPYHWEGSKCNLVKILQDGINNLFMNPAGPTDCEMNTMIEWMNNLVRPHSPHRALDDSLSVEARTGLMIMHRGSFKDVNNVAMSCSGRPQDPATEPKMLAAMGDPSGSLFSFNGGGGPFIASGASETCSEANCHVSPHWESSGFVDGNPGLGLADGFQAVPIGGAWDRPAIQHDGRASMERFLFALDTYRTFTGAPAKRTEDIFNGEIATQGFIDQFFRHPEYNFDGDPTTNGFKLTDTLTQFTMEEEELQTSAVGLTTVMDAATINDPDVNQHLQALMDASSQGKVVLQGNGILARTEETLTWDPVAAVFNVGSGGTLTLPQVKSTLKGKDALAFLGVLLPGQGSAPHPKLVAVTRAGSPIQCAEGYSDYLASVQIGETSVPLLLKGIDLVAGSQVMVNGNVTGAPLAGTGPDFLWTLPSAGPTPAVHSMQVLNPVGLQSNSIPLPVVEPVIPALEVVSIDVQQNDNLTILSWDSQFGVTGPGTRYDVFRGSIEDLRTAGFNSGGCLIENLVDPIHVDDSAPPAAIVYYLVRAENQVNASTWGQGVRDIQINGSMAACGEMFP